MTAKQVPRTLAIRVARLRRTRPPAMTLAELKGKFINPKLTNDPSYRRLLAEWQIWYNSQIRALLEFRGHAAGLPKAKQKR